MVISDLDSVEFCNSIFTNDRPRLIAMGFEQLMVLYDLVGKRENFSISENDSEPISFDLIMDTEGDAITLIGELNFATFSIGDSSYSITLGRQNNVVLVRITMEFITPYSGQYTMM